MKQMALALMLLLPGCASSSYMGIPLAAGKADPAIQELAIRARSGDKEAQFNLGMRYEKGVGLTQDTSRAIKLYRRAASYSGGSVWIYVPSPGNGAPAQITSFEREPVQLGSMKAQQKLKELGVLND